MPSLASVPAPLVLVAEDEDTVRSLLERTLQYEGYRVLAAADGAAALSVLEASGPVDLLIADIRMPRLGGDQLAHRALAARLARSVLFVTGYDTHPESAQMLGPVLLKPFGPDVLRESVAAILRGHPLPSHLY